MKLYTLESAADKAARHYLANLPDHPLPLDYTKTASDVIEDNYSDDGKRHLDKMTLIKAGLVWEIYKTD